MSRCLLLGGGVFPGSISQSLGVLVMAVSLDFPFMTL